MLPRAIPGLITQKTSITHKTRRIDDLDLMMHPFPSCCALPSAHCHIVFPDTFGCRLVRGTPRTMQQQPHYGDVVAEVREFLRKRVAHAVARGIPRASIAVDPGIGFGKTVAHNLALLARLAEFKELGCPIVVGTSRKSFIGKVLAGSAADGGSDRGVDQRQWGTAATVAWAVAHGARVGRVHDVAAMADVVRMVEAIDGAR